MIIGKIMMIQNSSSKESVEYLISKKIMELKGNIKDYTLNRFIEEVGVSFLILKMLCTKNICMRK